MDRPARVIKAAMAETAAAAEITDRLEITEAILTAEVNPAGVKCGMEERGWNVTSLVQLPIYSF